MATGRRRTPAKWVMVVDDNGPLRGTWIEVLEQAGYTAVGAADGLAAAELIQDLLPDLVLLDLQMPRLSGWGFLERLRAHPETVRIPVLIVSGYLDEGPDLTATGVNVVGCMAKPVTVAALLGKVREVIGPSSSNGR